MNKHTLGESRQNHHVVCLRSSRQTHETTEAKNSRSGFAFCKVVGQGMPALIRVTGRERATTTEGYTQLQKVRKLKRGWGAQHRAFWSGAKRSVIAVQAA